MYIRTREGLGEPSGPSCNAAQKRLDQMRLLLDIGNREWAKKNFKGAPIQNLIREVDGMIQELDDYIKSGCCEPHLRTLEQEVRNLQWRLMNDQVVLLGMKLRKEIKSAQERARKICAKI